MRQVSAAWLRTVVGSHTPRFRATLVTHFQTGRPTGATLPIIDGEVQLDGAADIRGSLDLTIPGSYWPVIGAADLAPQGNEIYVEVGIRYSDAAEEWLPLGYFRIKRVEQATPETGGPIRVSGQDRMTTIVRAKLLAPRVFSATDTVGDFVRALVLEVYPLAEITFDDDTDTRPLGRDVLLDSDRFAPLSNVAQAYGKIMYWDSRGALAFVTLPDPRYPVAMLTGARDGSLVSAPRELSDEDVVNAVVARGDAADETGGAYGVAIDSDPDSPTGYFSRFGPAPLPITSSLITTNAQASAAAAAELRRHSGIPYTLGLTVSPRPELEPFDAVWVEHKGMTGRERHVLSSITIPLRAGADMKLGTRQQSVVIVGGST